MRKINDMEAIYIRRLKKMTGEQRLKTASDLFEAAKEIAKAGILHQHPGISAKEAEKELQRRINL